MEEALAEAETYCQGYDVDMAAILDADKLQRALRIGKAQEALIAPDDVRRGFLRRADAALRGYRAVLPDERAEPFLRRVAALVVVAQAVRNQLGPPDISKLAAQVEALLDANILGVDIAAPVRERGDTSGLTDLSAIDFEKLAEAFVKTPRTTVEQMRATATEKVQEMVARNPTRVELIEKLEQLVDAYNSATTNVEETFEKLKAFLKTLDQEEGRAAREDLSEDELAIYDQLTRPEPKLTKAQEVQVKKIAKELLAKLQDKVSVFQWRQRQQTRSDVRWTIEQVLNELPEEPYPEELWKGKVEQTWQFVFGRVDRATGAGASLGLQRCLGWDSRPEVAPGAPGTVRESLGDLRAQGRRLGRRLRSSQRARMSSAIQKAAGGGAQPPMRPSGWPLRPATWPSGRPERRPDWPTHRRPQ